jgi:hypothetical protein
LSVLLGYGVHEVSERFNIDEAERGRDILVCHGIAREAYDLIERGLRITHRAFAGARYRQQRPVGYFDSQSLWRCV